MTDNDVCPDTLLLKKAIAGNADRVLESHIENCRRCQRRLDELSSLASLSHYRDHARNLNNASFALGPPISAGDLGSIGHLAIEGQIGSGAMGVVYRGRDTELNRSVAVKILARGSSMESDARFARESRAVAALNHPNIVPVLSAGRAEDGRRYLVMPLIEGPTLKEKLSQGPLPPRQAAETVRQIALGLAAAHSAQLIHRDVKPANILIDKSDATAMLTDFGLVRGATDETLTHRDIICGSPEFMSPEQAAHPDTHDPRCDIYSLGITLYECLTGTLPFRGKPLDVLVQHRELDPLLPSRLNQSIDRQVETICMKAIEKEPSRRYQSAVLFATDLQNYLDGKPIVARPAGNVEKFIRWTNRNPGMSLLSFALLVTLITGTVLSTWGWWEASKNLAEARSNFDTATELIVNKEKFAEQLAYTPGQEALSLELYQQLSSEVEQLAKLPTSDDRITYVAGNLFRRRAEFELLLGDIDTSVASCNKSNDLYRSISEIRPSRIFVNVNEEVHSPQNAIARHVSANMITLGECMYVANRPDDAHLYYQQAEDILVEAFGGLQRGAANLPFAIRRNIALILVLRGNVFRDLHGNDEKARECYEKALRIIQGSPAPLKESGVSGTESDPRGPVPDDQDLGLKHIDAFAHHFIGRHLISTAPGSTDSNESALRALEKGKAHLNRALTLRREISQTIPDSVRLARDVALTLVELAITELEFGNSEPALKHLDEAIQILDEIVVTSQRFEPLLRLSQALLLRATIRSEAGLARDSQQDRKRARALSESAVKICPQSWEAQKVLGLCDSKLKRLEIKW